eukprot:4963434-Amphidinium_carterae.1
MVGWMQSPCCCRSSLTDSACHVLTQAFDVSSEAALGSNFVRTDCVCTVMRCLRCQKLMRCHQWQNHPNRDGHPFHDCKRSIGGRFTPTVWGYLVACLPHTVLSSFMVPKCSLESCDIALAQASDHNLSAGSSSSGSR